jgi:hypothetical protein
VDALDLDPILLSREFQRANELRAAWERGLHDAPDPDDCPLGVYRALLSSERSEHIRARADDDPLKEPLLRWSWLLTERRVNQAWYARAAYLRYGRTLHVDEPEKGNFTAAQGVHNALAQPACRAHWLAALPALFAEHSRVLGVHWQRRRELSRRLDFDLDTIELPSPEVVAIAREWLAASAELAREFRARTLADVVALGLARESDRGFPSRINETTFLGWFGEAGFLRDLEPRAPRWPEPLGAASFYRALVQFGRAFRTAAVSDTQPFVVAHDPYGLEAWHSGFVFAGLLGSPKFLRRRLELSAEHALATRRALARVELFASRWLAFTVTLRALSLSSYDRLRKDLPELAHAALGVELHPDLALSLPRQNDDDAQRFAGWALAREQLRVLQEAHDEDWFRNPRAVDQVRSEAQLSPRTRVTDEQLRVGLGLSLDELSTILGS